MFGGNDLKMALRYSVKRTELANSNSGLLVSKLCHSILKTPDMVIHLTLSNILCNCTAL